jgi:hypothetical protein
MLRGILSILCYLSACIFMLIAIFVAQDIHTETNLMVWACFALITGREIL